MDYFWPMLDAALAAWEVHVDPAQALRDEGVGSATVAVGGKLQDYQAVVMSKPSLTAVLDAVKRIPPGRAGADSVLLIADHVPRATAEALRVHGIDYVDLGGSASIRFDDVVVAVANAHRAARLPEPVVVSPRPAPSNLFSPARAQVIFVALQWPDSLDYPVRELARWAGVSPGQAHATRSMLVEQAYLDEVGTIPRTNRRELRNREALLDAWVAAYRSGLRRRMHLGSFRADLATWHEQEQRDGVLVGGAFSVSDLLKPASVAVWTPALTSGMRARHQLVPTTDRPNTDVLRIFWETPDEQQDRSFLTGVERRPPWILDYAELATSPDPRLRTASHAVRRHAG